MTHLFKLDAAQQQVDRRRAPHIRLGQRLVADHWHADGVGLGRRVALALDVARGDWTFLNLGDRFTGGAVQHKDHALLAGLHQHRRGAAFTVRQIVQQRLGRQVEIPEIVMGGLIMPAYLAGRGVNGHDGGTVFIVQRGTFAAKEVRRCVTGRQINQIQLRVIGHGRPDVRRTAGVGLSGRRFAGQVRVARIPCPRQFAGMNIIGANDARGLAGGEVIRHATANHDHVTRHQRRGGLLVVTRFDFPHANAQVHNTVVAEGVAQFTVIGINSDQTGVGGWQEQAAGAGGRLRLGGRGSLGLALFVIA